MQTQTLLFRNARVTDAEKDLRCDILVQDGKVAAIGAVEPFAGCRIIECEHYTLMPSFVDLHAHFRDPGFPQKEDIHSGCKAAVHGGYTAVNLMANTNPVCSSMETIRYVRDKAAELDICRVHQLHSITQNFDGQTLLDFDTLDEQVLWLSDDGVGVTDTGVLLRAMQSASAKGIGLMLHEEEAALTPIDTYLMEELPTYRDVRLAGLTGCRTHFCHVSTMQAMEQVLWGKRQGFPITCEVTPHHLLLNDLTPGHVAPPLRGEEHRNFLVQCVARGLVDTIATDHAPHTPEDKVRGMNGFTGLDLSFSACYTALVEAGHITLRDLSRMMSRRPAQLLQLPIGIIATGAPADLVLVDTAARFVVTEEHIHSRSKNTPLLGMELCGRVQMTIKEGRIVYEAANY